MIVIETQNREETREFLNTRKGGGNKRVLKYSCESWVVKEESFTVWATDSAWEPHHAGAWLDQEEIRKSFLLLILMFFFQFWLDTIKNFLSAQSKVEKAERKRGEKEILCCHCGGLYVLPLLKDSKAFDNALEWDVWICKVDIAMNGLERFMDAQSRYIVFIKKKKVHIVMNGWRPLIWGQGENPADLCFMAH